MTLSMRSWLCWWIFFFSCRNIFWSCLILLKVFSSLLIVLRIFLYFCYFDINASTTHDVLSYCYFFEVFETFLNSSIERTLSKNSAILWWKSFWMFVLTTLIFLIFLSFSERSITFFEIFSHFSTHSLLSFFYLVKWSITVSIVFYVLSNSLSNAISTDFYFW